MTTTPNNLRELVQRYATVGRLEAIIARPQRRAPAQSLTDAQLEPGLGLMGDRRSQARRNTDSARTRELSLIQAEHLPVVASLCGLPTVDPLLLRRNLVISGINLLAMKSPFADMTVLFSIGKEVVIAVTGLCEPCSRMEEVLGTGGYNAMRGHGGVTAMVITGGRICVGDEVSCSGLSL